jgi:Protein of unknown function (DUF1493)
MGAAEIEQALREKLRAWATPEEALDGAIYQDMGINGQDFYELLCEIDDQFKLPAFDWSEYADMNEPPEGLSFFGRLKILPRKRLTISHLSEVIAAGIWSEP